MAVGVAGTMLVLATLAVTAAAMTRSGGPESMATDGPMRTPVEHGMVVTERQAGDRFTDGFEVLLLAGDEPATIVEVESIGGSDTFRQVGALLAGPDRKFSSTNYYRRYPPTDRTLGELVAVEGAVVQPRDQTRKGLAYELLVGYEILDDTRVGYRSALEVTYRIGEEQFVWRSPARLLYCPEPMSSQQCQAVADADDWGE